MKIWFDKYKGFGTRQEMEVRPVTVLIGKNNSGKSSVLKLIASLLDSVDGQTPYPGLDMGRPNSFSLGSSFGNIGRNGALADLQVGIEIEGISIDATLFRNAKGQTAFSDYSFSSESNRRDFKRSSQGILTAYDGAVCSGAFRGLWNKEVAAGLGIEMPPSAEVDYIGPLRTIPSRVIYTPPMAVSNMVGFRGEGVYPQLCSEPDLLNAVNDWFESNVEGNRITVEQGKESGSFIMKVGSEKSLFAINIADVGMGISQVLPIVAASLNTKGAQTVLVEQPELHLHPAAHAGVGHLMATASASLGKTFIVETHSANLLLGIREAVADPEHPLTKEDVIIYFIDEDSDGAYLMPIELDEQGTPSRWPEGVFGETYDLLKSIRAKSIPQTQG